jgi:hypothetical protein
VAHAYNPTYSGGTSQEVQSQPRQTILKNNTHHKKGPVEWLNTKALSSRPSTAKKKKRKAVTLSSSKGTACFIHVI